MNFEIKLPEKVGEFPISIYDMVFTKTYTLSVMLSELKEPDATTLMGSIIDVYRSYGWQREASTQKTPVSKAIIEPPFIHHTRCYHLIAVVADDIETYLQQRCDPTFNVADVMLKLCDDFHVHHSKTFPSRRYQVGNEEPVSLSINYQKKKKKEEEKKIFCNTVDDEHDPSVETFGLPNPRFNVKPPLTEQEKKEKMNESKRDRRRDATTRKRTHTAYMNEKFQRLLPISLLPIFLMYMPEAYHRVNQSLIVCETLEKNLWTTIPHWKYDTHVGEQLTAMAHNRHYVTTMRQSKELILQLKQNELLMTKVNALLEREDDEKYDDALLAVLNK
jgi:hypothetical protein